MTQTMQDRIDYVCKQVAAAAERSGRTPKDIHLIAVTKYVSLDTTKQALDLGLLHIGENRWQDVQPKWEALHERGTWHFIGHLQTNKVKDVVGRFAYIHSLDRLSLAKEIEKKAAALGIVQNCFLQINVSGEQSKYGLPPKELHSFAEHLRDMPHIRVAGFMTMAPFEAEAEATRPVFRRLRELRDELNRTGTLGYEALHLSMGMSGDYEVAIEEGATWIRLGTALVGKEA